MKIMDAIGLSLLLTGIGMTIFLYFGHTGPSAEVRDFKIWEVPTPSSQGEKI